jgi:hypothetical protein
MYTKRTLVVWIETPCRLEERYRRFGGKIFLSTEYHHTKLLIITLIQHYSLASGSGSQPSTRRCIPCCPSTLVSVLYLEKESEAYEINMLCPSVCVSPTKRALETTAAFH